MISSPDPTKDTTAVNQHEGSGGLLAGRASRYVRPSARSSTGSNK
jgi:hypothetical protein